MNGHAFEGSRLVPLVLHPVLEPEDITADQRLQLTDEVRRAALGYVTGHDSRSIREIAEMIGVRKSTVANAIQEICRKVGIRDARISDRKRRLLREARARVMARKQRKAPLSGAVNL